MEPHENVVVTTVEQSPKPATSSSQTHTRNSDPAPVLLLSSGPGSQHTHPDDHQKQNHKPIRRRSLNELAKIQVCFFSIFISLGAALILAGLVLTVVGYSVSPQSEVTPQSEMATIIIRGHRTGGLMLLGFGCSLFAFGIICCIYSKRPPVPRRPPPPRRMQQPRTSITGVGSTTTIKGVPPDNTRTRRKCSLDLPEPEQTTGLPEQHVNAVVDLDHPDG